LFSNSATFPFRLVFPSDSRTPRCARPGPVIALITASNSPPLSQRNDPLQRYPIQPLPLVDAVERDACLASPAGRCCSSRACCVGARQLARKPCRRSSSFSTMRSRTSHRSPAGVANVIELEVQPDHSACPPSRARAHAHAMNLSALGWRSENKVSLLLLSQKPCSHHQKPQEAQVLYQDAHLT
jgi:hypothetical protein